MNGNGYAQPEQYAQYATEMSGAPPAAGMPAYPLYGLPHTLGQTDEVPVWRRPSVCFAAGAVVVGAMWAYFGWWRPRQTKARVAKNAEEKT